MPNAQVAMVQLPNLTEEEWRRLSQCYDHLIEAAARRRRRLAQEQNDADSAHDDFGGSGALSASDAPGIDLDAKKV